MSVRWPNRRGVDHPLGWNDLFSVPCAVMSEQAAKARVVAQHRIEAEVGKLEPFSVQEPLRVVFRADRFPYSIVQILGCRSVDGIMKHHSQHVRFDACVVVPCTGGAIRRLNCAMLRIVPLPGNPDPVTMSPQSRLRSRPPSRSSPKSTPEDMWRRSRIGVTPYSVPLRPGT